MIPGAGTSDSESPAQARTPTESDGAAVTGSHWHGHPGESLGSESAPWPSAPGPAAGDTRPAWDSQA